MKPWTLPPFFMLRRNRKENLSCRAWKIKLSQCQATKAADSCWASQLHLETVQTQMAFPTQIRSWASGWQRASGAWLGHNSRS